MNNIIVSAPGVKTDWGALQNNHELTGRPQVQYDRHVACFGDGSRLRLRIHIQLLRPLKSRPTASIPSWPSPLGSCASSPRSPKSLYIRRNERTGPIVLTLTPRVGRPTNTPTTSSPSKSTPRVWVELQNRRHTIFCKRHYRLFFSISFAKHDINTNTTLPPAQHQHGIQI